MRDTETGGSKGMQMIWCHVNQSFLNRRTILGYAFINFASFEASDAGRFQNNL